MAAFNGDIGVYEIVYTGVVQGVGLGFIFVPLSATAFATLAPRFRSEGTAMFSLVRNIGSSIGISLMVTVLGREAQSSHAILSESVTPFRAALHLPNVPALWSSFSELGLVALNAEVSRQALTVAYVNSFRFMMFVTLLAVPLLFFLRKPAPPPRPKT
jgi:DHA2 family multidrug resistance protein